MPIEFLFPNFSLIYLRKFWDKVIPLQLNESYNCAVKAGGLYSVSAGFNSLLDAGHSAGSVS